MSGILDPRECEYYRVYVKHAWGDDGTCNECGLPRPAFLSADEYDWDERRYVNGVTVEVGRKYWDNDLRVVKITALAERGQEYADTGESQWWHSHTRGISDTMTGDMRKYGRLARWFEGRDAEKYEPGTKYADVK